MLLKNITLLQLKDDANRDILININSIETINEIFYIENNESKFVKTKITFIGDPKSSYIYCKESIREIMDKIANSEPPHTLP